MQVAHERDNNSSMYVRRNKRRSWFECSHRERAKKPGLINNAVHLLYCAGRHYLAFAPPWCVCVLTKRGSASSLIMLYLGKKNKRSLHVESIYVVWVRKACDVAFCSLPPSLLSLVSVAVSSSSIVLELFFVLFWGGRCYSITDYRGVAQSRSRRVHDGIIYDTIICATKLKQTKRRKIVV